MTLVLTLGNVDQVIQVSDRRLSWDGSPVDNESNKAGVLTCFNAAQTFGFSGLAWWGDSSGGLFDTWQWLLDALYESGPPDYTAKEILVRLRDRASETFSRNPVLRSAPRKHKRLSIMFSGYLYHHNPPLMVYAILTNYQGFQTGRDNPDAWDEFILNFRNERRPLDHEPTLVQRVGSWRAMTEKDEEVLRALLQARKPARAIIGKAVDLVREMADRSTAQKAIGKKLSVICLPRNWSESVKSGYFSEALGYVDYMVDWVVLSGDSNRIISRDYQTSVMNTSGLRPIVIPKVGRNWPCPCGSKKKYKHCCGRFAF